MRIRIVAPSCDVSTWLPAVHCCRVAPHDSRTADYIVSMLWIVMFLVTSASCDIGPVVGTYGARHGLVNEMHFTGLFTTNHWCISYIVHRQNTRALQHGLNYLPYKLIAWKPFRAHLPAAYNKKNWRESQIFLLWLPGGAFCILWLSFYVALYLDCDTRHSLTCLEKK